MPVFKAHRLRFLASHRTLIALYIVLCGSILVFSNGSTFGSPDDFCTLSARYFADGCTSTDPIQMRGLLDASISQASNQGRFYQIVYYTLTQFAFALNSDLIVTAIRVTTILGLLHSSYVFALKAIGQKVALFVPLGFSIIFSLTSGYNAVTGFPLWMMLGQTFLLYAFSVFYDLRQQFSWIRAAAMAGLLLMGVMSYEALIFQSIALFGVVVFARPRGPQKLKELFASYGKPIYVLAACAAIYLALYAGYSNLNPSDYVGSRISLGTLADTSETLVLLSSAHFLTTGGIVVRNFYDLRFVTVWVSILLLVTILLLGFRSGVKDPPDGPVHVRPKLSQMRTVVLAGVLILASAAPNLPLALTERYRVWVETDPVYLGTMYSAVLQALAVALGLDLLMRIRKQSWALVGAVLVGSLASSTLAANLVLFRDRLDREWIYSEAVSAVQSLQFSEQDAASLFADFSALKEFSGSGGYRFWDPFILSRSGVLLTDEIASSEVPKQEKRVVRFYVDVDARQVSAAWVR